MKKKKKSNASRVTNHKKTVTIPRDEGECLNHSMAKSTFRHELKWILILQDHVETTPVLDKEQITESTEVNAIETESTDKEEVNNDDDTQENDRLLNSDNSVSVLICGTL